MGGTREAMLLEIGLEIGESQREESGQRYAQDQRTHKSTPSLGLQAIKITEICSLDPTADRSTMEFA